VIKRLDAFLCEGRPGVSCRTMHGRIVTCLSTRGLPRIYGSTFERAKKWPRLPHDTAPAFPCVS
jgi:hypothetical protein